METVNQYAQAAAKAVWGDSSTKSTTEEPVSGVTGDTAKGEPFDAGNREDQPQTTADNTLSGQRAEDKVPSEHREAADFSKTTGTAATSDDTPANPSTDLKAEQSHAQDTTKGQNDVRDPEDPNTNPKSAPTDVDNTGEGPNEAQKLGPGPKPLEEVARKHGGDAGATSTAPGGSGVKTGDAEKKPGNDDDDGEDGPNAKSTGDGTGEKYIKSSGLKVDGGDFDATKPGAGREADRLMEEKGMHPNEGASAGPTTTDDHHKESEGKEKKKLSERIKEKLHRN